MLSVQNSTSKPSQEQKLANMKRAKQFKQFLRILNELNQNVYICVQDKKKGTV